MHLLLCYALFATSLIITELASAEVNFSQPVTAAEYHQTIKEGFSTNYFKGDNQLRKHFGYDPQNIQDIYDRGFHNVRLRCRPEKVYNPPYEEIEFTWFLDNLTMVVDDCIRIDVAPIISWEHHQAEAHATEEERELYLIWWGKVAERLKDRNYHLSFNLFTELGVDFCKDDCSASLRTNITKYNDWTAEVVRTIRATGGKNTE